MDIKQILSKDLKKADKFKQAILNPENKRRYRPWSTVYKNHKREPSLFIGAYDKDKLIGIIFGYIKKSKILIGEMAVSEKYRNKGIGSKLINFFEKQVKKLNKKEIVLGSWESAEKFYLKQGYKPQLFIQIPHDKVPKDYKKMGYDIIKETNYKDAKKLTIRVNKLDDKLKQKAKKNFNTDDVIYLFRKEV